MEKLSPEQFNEKYEDFMLDGLTSYNTYIPLKSNKRVGINIAIRPYVMRLSDGALLFGGKLRVGYTLEGGEYVKTKIVDLHPEQRVERLKDFCKGFSWQKQSEARFSTVMGIGVAASIYEPEVLEKIVEEGLSLQFLNKLESTYSQYNEGQTFNAKRKAAAALLDAWLLQAEGHFRPTPQMLDSGAALGKTSKVLNKAQDAYHDNVVSFEAKVAELKNAE